MVYDEKLATRIRAVFEGDPRIAERKMFGGLCFTLNGHMCCGIVKDTLMLRVGADAYEKAVSLPNARPMDFTGKPMKGMIYVDPAGFRSAASLLKWVKLGADFAGALPAKAPKMEPKAAKTKAPAKRTAKAKASSATPRRARKA